MCVCVVLLLTVDVTTQGNQYGLGTEYEKAKLDEVTESLSKAEAVSLLLF